VRPRRPTRTDGYAAVLGELRGGNLVEIVREDNEIGPDCAELQFACLPSLEFDPPRSGGCTVYRTDQSRTRARNLYSVGPQHAFTRTGIRGRARVTQALSNPREGLIVWFHVTMLVRTERQRTYVSASLPRRRPQTAVQISTDAVPRHQRTKASC